MEAKINSKESREESFDFQLSWQKGRVVSVEPDLPVAEAAEIMKDQQIGTVLVISNDADGQELQGIVTDRDIALCIASEDEIDDLVVSDIMSESLVTASTRDDVFKLIHLMKDSGITRLPLLDDNNDVVGVVTARNLIEVLLGSLFDLTQISEKQQEKERARH